MFYADDLALVSETSEDLKGRFEAWKGALESKGLRVNVKKAKMMISEYAGLVTVVGKGLCALYRKSVCSNSILREFCRCWMHTSCSGIRGQLK